VALNHTQHIQKKNLFHHTLINIFKIKINLIRKNNQMSIIISTGSNQGDRFSNLSLAKNKLSTTFELIAESRVYKSKAVDYLEQPYFYNQVLEFKSNISSATHLMNILLDIEDELGRLRTVPKGPRIIDIDLIFLGTKVYKDNTVEVPHPRAFNRSFVILPLKELPYYSTIKQLFKIPTQFKNNALPIKKEITLL